MSIAVQRTMIARRDPHLDRWQVYQCDK